MIQTIDNNLVDSLIAEAKCSPRKRTNYNFHQTLDENPHRFLNVMLKGSYFTPHRHLNPPKNESFLVLQGEIGFLIFNEEGKVTTAHRLSPDGLRGTPGVFMGIDITPGIWHCLVVLSEIAVCYEVKPGPYDPTSDKEFADWAPHEGDEGTDAYTRSLLEHFDG